MVKRMIIICALIAFGCTGCGSGIVVTRFDGTAATMKGVPYNLPMTTFKITVTRRLTECGVEAKTAMDIKIESSKALDPKGMFTLSSNGWFTTSDIKSTFAPDGTSTALNMSSTDQTATVIANVLSTVVSCATLAVTRGLRKAEEQVMKRHSEAPNNVCKEEVREAVGKIKTLTGTVSKEADELTAATDKVTLLTSQIAALGDSADKTIKHDMVKALADQTILKTKLANHKKELEAAQELTSDTQIINWPNDGMTLTGGPYSVDLVKVSKKWFNADQRVFGEPEEIKIKFEEIKKKFDVYLQLERTGSLGLDTTNLKEVPKLDISQGVPVRFPAPGKLKVCTIAECRDLYAKVIKDEEYSILQLGLVYTVPALGGTFKSESMALTTDATTGAPTMIQVMVSTAAASTATGALKDTATKIGSMPSTIDAAKLTKIKAQTDLLTAEHALKEAKATIDNAEKDAMLAVIEEATALAKAKLALINADAALKAAQ